MKKFRKFLTHIHADVLIFVLVIFGPPFSSVAFFLGYELTFFPFHFDSSYIRVYPENTSEPCGNNYVVYDSIYLAITFSNSTHSFPLMQKHAGEKLYYEGELAVLFWNDSLNVDSVYTNLRKTFPTSRITIVTPKGVAQIFSIYKNSHNEITLYYPILWILDKFDYMTREMVPILVLLIYLLPISIYIFLLILKKILRVKDGDV